MSKRVVLFDLDGTLTRLDSFPVFLAWALLYRPWRIVAVIGAVPALAAFWRKHGAASSAKQALLRAAVGKLTQAQARGIVRSFVLWVLPLLLRPRVVERLRAHRDAGDRVWIVSGSLQLLCEQLALHWHIEGALGTELEVADGRVSGRFKGLNCVGAEKVRRLRAALGNTLQDVAIVYGDHPTRDGPMWALGKTAVRVPGPLPDLVPDGPPGRSRVGLRRPDLRMAR